MTVRLSELAGVIRSKNAGPYELTLDIIFHDRATFDAVVAAKAIDRDLVARLYAIPPSDVLELVAFDPAHAIKITIRRPAVAGHIGETDVYGAQQHAPLLGVEIDLGWSTSADPTPPSRRSVPGPPP